MFLLRYSVFLIPASFKVIYHDWETDECRAYRKTGMPYMENAGTESLDHTFLRVSFHNHMAHPSEV